MLDIAIDRNKCNCCGFCVDACPLSILYFDKAETQVLIQDIHNCLVCRNCEEHCPRRCLSVVFPEWLHRSTVGEDAQVTPMA